MFFLSEHWDFTCFDHFTVVLWVIRTHFAHLFQRKWCGEILHFFSYFVEYPHLFYTPQANSSVYILQTCTSVYIMANYFIFFKIAEFWFVFRNFFSVPEVSKNNSKACFCFSIARRLLGTTKNHHKKYRNNFHFYTKPQASRRTHMSSRYRTCVPEVTVSELKGFTWGLIGLGYGSDSRVCS